MGHASSCAPKASRTAFLSSFAIVACALVGAPVHAANPLDSLALVYDDGMGHTLPYRLFLPPGYDEPGAEFPLVLFLHGAGERGDDNLAQVNTHIDGLIDATQSDRFASFLLAPQAPAGGGWSHFGSVDQLNPSTQLVTEIIAQLETEYQIDPTRRYVTGLSMGGFGTFDLIAKRPDMFAAAVPMSGGGDPSRAADMANVPLWDFHGSFDSVVSADASRVMIQALADVGSDPIYLEPGGDHAIWDAIYDDPNGELYSWMFEGTPPPLATLMYNPLNGDLKVDATTAPGGNIWTFYIQANVLSAPQGFEIAGGQVFVHPDGIAMIYRSTIGAGFGGVVDLGNVLPAGLKLSDLDREFTTSTYSSSPTGAEQRPFRFRIAVPEPSALGLLVATVPTAFSVRRRRGNVLR